MQPSYPPVPPQPDAAAAPNQPSVTPPAPVIANVPPAPQPVPSAAATATAPAIADDNDLIEKEWVVQVKKVLSANADNPYEQNRQLTLLKAEYLQKRYGKDLKVDS